MASINKNKIIDFFNKPLPKWQIKIFLAVIALVIAVAVIFFTQLLIDKLIDREQRIIQFYANTAQFIYDKIAIEEKTDYVELLENMTTTISFPLIVTDSNDVPLDPYYQNSLNIDIDESKSDEELKEYFQDYVNEMKSAYEPIVINVKLPSGEEEILNKFYYTESPLIQTLRYFPYVAIIAISAFVFIGYLAFSSIRRNEQSKIWVGMSKEAAHQLGTPLSSLLAWVEILRFQSDDPDALNDTLNEMEKDVNRLNMIATRFSKIGSKPEMKIVDVAGIIESAAQYFEKRLPHLGKKVEIIKDLNDHTMTRVNPDLLTWVIENLIKNAAEAIEEKEGKIYIYSKKNDQKKLQIYVKDTGKGMTNKQKRQAFNPGFTTKKRGWGLGLSLCKRIIEEYHEGRIYIKDSNPGKGTTFAIEIPIEGMEKEKV